MGYKYFDTPMGQDTLKKLWYTTKITGTAGIAWSTIDVMLYSKPQGYLRTIGRYMYITGPFIGIAAAFTVTANMATTLRKKDDYLNYVLGGIAAGCMTGAWRRSFLIGFLWSVAFSAAAVVTKSSVDEGFELFPEPKHKQITMVNTRNFDFTLTKERPRNWIVGDEK